MATIRSPDESASPGPTRLHLASWWNRFFAWLIDVILVGGVTSTVGDVAGVYSLTVGEFSATLPLLSINGLVFWVYWTVLEGYHGQSAGKLVMSIAVTDERGGDIDYVTAAIQSFGKAFLLPLDCLIGWLAMSGEYVRVFNRLSGTIVVEQADAGSPEDVEYVKPD
ncbi:RDD family protein [Halorhabdus amylolytica]|uniref:RDD family protein n=1 Tax=Halorhabdus amylolytica TaxID=2559573 RepID=UPI0010AAA47F|nr:RDD family protein [Halorhabdus amylolytica]